MPSQPVRVILPGLLRDLVGGVSEIPVDVPDTGDSVAGVLDRAFTEHRILDGRVRDELGRIRPHVKVFVNGEDVTRGEGTGSHVPPAARVHIINAVSGG
jgi:molybdopterin synthase sulfur carrier subunit